jgi:uracil-DNA glycosylase family 4
MMDATAELRRISEEVQRCRKCPLWEERLHAVPGEGPSNPEVMIIGEAPGRNEDLHGRPFVGEAGRNLDTFLQKAAIERKQVFITNTVKCRPPANRRPNRKELDTCHQYLRRQMELLSPKITVLLGDVALKELFPTVGLSKVHGRVLTRDGRSFFPTYHPAAVIYNRRLKETLDNDFRALAGELGRGAT